MKSRVLLWASAWTASVAAIVVVSSIVDAQDVPEASGGYRICIVNRKQVWEGYAGWQEEKARLEKRAETMEAEVEEYFKTAEELRKEYEEKEDGLKAEERASLRQEINKQFRLWQSETKRLQGDLDDMTEEAMRSVLKEIDEAVAFIGARDNFHLILDGDREGPAGSTYVLYYSETLDITGRVLEYLNGQ